MSYLFRILHGMRELESRLDGQTVVSREMVLEAGGSDDMIAMRLRNGWWTHLHAGVYRIGPRADDWLERLQAAVLAAGQGAVVSHRAAYVLWGLDGIDTQLVELTVPYEHLPVPKAVILHRTRRTISASTVMGITVTAIERTLLDCSPQLPHQVLAKGLDSALRLGLTDPLAVAKTIAEQGGRGVRGVRKLERVLLDLDRTGPTGSPAELELLVGMKDAGLPPPVLQWEVLANGLRYKVDFGWPDVRKGVEVDGLDAHSGAENLERDLQRQNDLLAAGIELRRFTARQVRRHPTQVVEEIRRFLTYL
ncbi:MAG TPA: DUF559 domain-containing protein [Acidimicrobiia bacterium]|nr:DUF559 domain-containing protein [Acidimicrobiia bacterium]